MMRDPQKTPVRAAVPRLPSEIIVRIMRELVKVPDQTIDHPARAAREGPPRRSAISCMSDAAHAGRVDREWLRAWHEVDVDDAVWKDAVHSRWPQMADVRFETVGHGVWWRSAFVDQADDAVPLECVSIHLHFFNPDHPGLLDDPGLLDSSLVDPSDFTLVLPLSSPDGWCWPAPELINLKSSGWEDYSVSWMLHRSDTGQNCQIVGGAYAGDGSLSLDSQDEGEQLVHVDGDHDLLCNFFSPSALITMDALCSRWQTNFDDVVDRGEFLPFLSFALGNTPMVKLELWRRSSGYPHSEDSHLRSAWTFGSGDEDSLEWLRLHDWDDSWG